MQIYGLSVDSEHIERYFERVQRIKKLFRYFTTPTYLVCLSTDYPLKRIDYYLLSTNYYFTALCIENETYI